MAELSQDLRIFITQRAGETVVELGGELDARTVDALDDHLGLAVAEGRVDVLVDMSLVTFCDSIALRCLIRAERDLRHAGRRLRIINPSARVTRLLELTSLQALADGSHSRNRPTLNT